MTESQKLTMTAQKQVTLKKYLRVLLDRQEAIWPRPTQGRTVQQSGKGSNSITSSSLRNSTSSDDFCSSTEPATSSPSVSYDKNGKAAAAALIPTTSRSSLAAEEGRSSNSSSKKSETKNMPRLVRKNLDDEKIPGIKRARSSESSPEKSSFGVTTENNFENLDDSNDFAESPNCSESQLDNIELIASGVQFDSKPCSKIILTLDVLLADKIQQDELDKMNKELQDDMLRGEVSSMLAEYEPDELLPEHREKIEQLKDFPQFKMNESPPWETVFKASKYCCLFTPSLYPSHFRFVPGKSKIDNTLAETKDVWSLDFLLKSDILRVAWCAVSNKNLILRWLFFIMSVHKEMAVSESCYKVIMNAIQLQRSASRTRKTWAPEMADVLRLFINYGASFEDLVPEKDLFKVEDLRSVEMPVNSKQKPGATTNHAVNDAPQTTEEQEPDSDPPHLPAPEPHYKISNLANVLSVFAFAIESRPSYTSDQLTALFLMLCKIRMDIGIATRSVVYKIQAVLSRIIQKYKKSEWPQKMIYLSGQLSNFFSHHHNMLFLTETLPHCVRSIQLRRHLATLQLYITVGLDVSEIRTSPDIKISCLLDVFPFLKGFVQSELYKMYTAIDLLTIAVGDSSLNSSDREDLHKLMDRVTQLSEMLRDNGRMVACSTVKSKLVVLCTKWKILIESLSLTQKSLFAFTRQQALMSPTTAEMTPRTYDSDSDTNSSSFSSSVSSILSLPEI